MEMIHDTATFQNTINSEKPVMIKFSANWCPDCKRMDMFIGDILEDICHWQVLLFRLKKSVDEINSLSIQYLYKLKNAYLLRRGTHF